MSTNPTEPNPATTPAPAAKPAEPADQPRTFTQDEVNAFVAEQKRKERESLAAKYGDLDQLKALAEAQKAAEDAAKTQAQKDAEEIARLKSENLDAKRIAFAATKGIPPELITGSTQEEWDAAATKALEWKGAKAETPPPPAPTAHAAGNNGAPAGSPGDIDAQIAQAEKEKNFLLAIALKQRKAAASQTQ